MPKLEALELARSTVTTKTINNLIKENCDSKGNQKSPNTSKAIREAIISLKKRTDEGSLVVMPTDKSGKLSCMSLEEMGREHIGDDKVIDEGELNEIQRNLNNHSRMIIKTFNVGSNHGESNMKGFCQKSLIRDCAAWC